MRARKIATAPARAARATWDGLKALSQMVFSRQGGLVWRFLPRTRFDYAAEVGDGLGSSVLMAPVLWICRNFPSAPVQVLDADSAPIEDHPMVRLLRRPNPHYSGRTLWKATQLSLGLSGNGYWIKVWNRAGSSVVQVWYAPHWMMEPRSPDTAMVAPPADTKLGDDFISHYEYSVEGQIFALRIEDVVHFRDGLDPNEPRKGLSPLGSLFREIFTDDEAANFSASLLKNLGVPGLIVSPKGEHSPSPDDVQATKEFVDEEFSGDRRGKPMTMSGPTEVSQFGFSPEQMTLRELRRIPEERATAIHGVPAIVAGLGAGLDRSTFANFAEAREAAYEEKIIPSQDEAAEELRHQLLPDFGEEWERQEVAFDRSQVRVLQEDENKKAERVRGLWVDGGITRKELREALRMEASDADDVYRMPINAMLLGADERFVLGGGEPAPDDGEEKRKGRPRPLAKQAATEGAMVALYPPAETAAALAQEGGEPAEDLHLTLAFLTDDATEVSDPDRLASVVEGFAATAPALSGRVSGVGHFSAGPEPVTYAGADVPGLSALRERLVDALRRAGHPPSAEHGFTPHLTLAYAEIEPEIGNLPLAFDTLTLRLGAERHDFALTGTEPKRRRRRRSISAGKARAADPDEYQRGLAVIEALDRDQAALAAAFARELEPELAGLGRIAADAYTERAEPGLVARSNGRTKAADEEIAAAAATAAAEWADDRLRARFETHWARTAQSTVQTINSVIELGVSIPDPVARELIRAGGTRAGLLDVEAAAKRAIMRAISDGRAEGLNPIEIARRIRELVPAGRFTEAGPAYRAKLIARTETIQAQRMSALKAYAEADTVRAVIAYDGRLGETDAECAGRDGQEFGFADAEAESANEHPNGTLSWGPAIASTPAELVPA